MKPTQKPFIVQFIEKLAVYRSVSIETILTEIHLRQVDWEEIIGGSRSLTSTEREKLAEVFEMPDSLILLLNTRSPNILVQSIQKGVIGSFAKYTIGTMLCLREPGLGGALKLIRDIRKMTQAEVGQRVWSVEDVVFWEKTTCDASMLGDNGLSQFANGSPRG